MNNDGWSGIIFFVKLRKEENMKSKKFLVTPYSFIAKKLENWKCEKCGSLEEPTIYGKKDDNGEIVEMYIKCKNCDRLITVSKFE